MSTSKDRPNARTTKPRAPALNKPPRHSHAKKPSGVEPDDALSIRHFAMMAHSELRLPVDAYVIGESVTITKVHDPDLPRVGLLARCQRSEHSYDVNLADVVFPPNSPGASLAARYREWLGLPLMSNDIGLDSTRPHKVASDDIVIGKPVELVVLACKSNATRCRLLRTTREITLRTAVRFEVPGSIITVAPSRVWTHARHPYLSGNITATRAAVSELGLTPLALRDCGDWDPDSEYWGEEDEPIQDWAKPIIAHGKRPMFEMEQVIPGADLQDFDSDPIVMAADLRRAGDLDGAYDLLMNTLAKDLRCVDAHAHLGNLEFDRRPKQALQHYEMGTAIGALTLGQAFEGVLPWGLTDNRPFLRCLHGTGLCAWRLGDVRAAKAVFTRMLWLNPNDNQGARFNLAAVDAGKTWEEMEAEET